MFVLAMFRYAAQYIAAARRIAANVSFKHGLNELLSWQSRNQPRMMAESRLGHARNEMTPNAMAATLRTPYAT
jgi:hypothetical protein